MPLTDRQVRAAKAPGVLIDGKGLRLKITANARSGELRKNWIWRGKVDGGPVREIGLGGTHDVSLEAARKRAYALREQARVGIDPLTARQTERAQKAAEAARAMSFRDCAERYIEAHETSWKNAKHRQQWTNTLAQYCFPAFGDVAVSDVDQGMVMLVLEPLWAERTETASRLRGRIEAVLDWASVRGLRSGSNPARWRGHLDKLLPKRSKVQRVQHHPALPYDELPTFMATLREAEGLAARALEFCILTATRSSETLEARWDEIDLDKRVWTIPDERMKAGRAHRVPLSADAVKLLRSLKPSKGKAREYVFEGAKPGRPLSNMSMLQVLRRMKRTDVVTHGFRSTFRDWCAERTRYPREVAEAALAHVNADKVEAAYRRSDLFDRRRELMAQWATYCSSPPASSKVVPIRKRKD
ncbi:tyrosine-type recombinase/integrase [Candidatus Viadribacter manganicus]|uniref:Integrase n=1 Tax=Candidatus Viadribacter manganicus TaxID=1759059 RepID=A0A1B1AD52_9PROT|nr:site-specific integrase [Candidatus Viadribacter manganicus]ANP44486.1 integrase [Candidatus Viadribacter manganicus]